jgi:hypothetical protein
LSPLVPGLLVVTAGLVQGDGALISAAHRGASTVSDERLSFPWDGATAVTTSSVWAVTQVLLVVGLVGFVRSDAAASRAGRLGGAAAVLGASLFVPAHVLSILGRDAVLDDTVAVVVIALFAVGTLLQALGLAVSGASTIRSGVWSGWARWTPLAVAVTMLALLPLQFTPLLAAAVGFYAAAVVALGLAMMRHRDAAMP